MELNQNPEGQEPRIEELAPKFAFALGDHVNLSLSHEEGIVIGRAEYTNIPPQYFVRYVAADGRQVQDWFCDDAIEHVGEGFGEGFDFPLEPI